MTVNEWKCGRAVVVAGWQLLVALCESSVHESCFYLDFLQKAKVGNLFCALESENQFQCRRKVGESESGEFSATLAGWLARTDRLPGMQVRQVGCCLACRLASQASQTNRAAADTTTREPKRPPLKIHFHLRCYFVRRTTSENRGQGALDIMDV